MTTQAAVRTRRILPAVNGQIFLQSIWPQRVGDLIELERLSVSIAKCDVELLTMCLVLFQSIINSFASTFSPWVDSVRSLAVTRLDSRSVQSRTQSSAVTLMVWITGVTAWLH